MTIKQVATMWRFRGVFFGGDKDQSGTPIGDICTGYFVTTSDDKTAAGWLIRDRYEATNPGFEFRLDKIEACPCPTNPKRPAQILKRGGTKDIPVLARRISSQPYAD